MKLVLNEDGSLKAINPKYQTLVNRCISWHIKYDHYVTQGYIADGEGDFQTQKRADKKAADAWEKVIEYSDKIPLRELNQIHKFLE